ncbi:macromomycin [Planomonospora sp. ID67723]|uniref:enediyne antibiotic chromoprotein n=1 Tax=Planomonospora sp. ID67723 TaxID=2738134 RepID=UPI0018C40F15|nr:enediyne antibiotic chromoprotein [Planomonospora sp. ID67723]MBG0828240.1 macromomycin [Planomonospora sp. ID67723]
MQKKTGFLVKLGVAATVAAGALTLVSQPAALAAAPGFSVTPAAGLSDGDTVTVAITGATAGEQFSVVQCATVAEQLACNEATAKTVTVGADGSVGSTFVVRKSFQGVTPPASTPVGTVDCTVVTCFVSAGNESSFLGSQALSFTG